MPAELAPSVLSAIESAVHSALANASPPPERFLNIPEVIEITCLSRAEIYRKRNNGQFPQPYQISKKRVVWKMSDVQHWIGEQVQA